MMSQRIHGQRSRNMIRCAVALAGAVAIAGSLAACNSSDPTAPTDSTITVSANPQTVVVPSGGQGSTEITATVRSKNGTRIPDQEVTFSTTSGTLEPPAESPVITNNDGQAFSTLLTASSATVTARSGSISGTTQITTVTGNISTVVLDVPIQNLTACTDQLDMDVTVSDANGDPLQGISVSFSQETSPTPKLTGTFNPSSAVTDASGIASTVWTPSPTICPTTCTLAGDPNGGGNCGDLFIFACASSCSFQSNVVTLHDNIP